MLTRTPRVLTPKLRTLANDIVPGLDPVYVPVRPMIGSSLNECFANVDTMVRLEGGFAVFGWALWEWPGVMIEAEFHSVWQSPSGELLDISPRVGEETDILFLPDPTRVWNERQVNNHRRALRDDPIVHEFISIADRIFEVLNAGTRAQQLGLLSVPAAEIEPLLVRKAQLLARLQARPLGRNDPCSCRSGKKFKRCCGAM
jgi:hypothetical protein